MLTYSTYSHRGRDKSLPSTRQSAELAILIKQDALHSNLTSESTSQVNQSHEWINFTSGSTSRANRIHKYLLIGAPPRALASHAPEWDSHPSMISCRIRTAYLSDACCRAINLVRRPVPYLSAFMTAIASDTRVE